MYLPLPTPTEMNSWDHSAIHDAGIPAELLMENAAREAFRVLSSCFAPVRHTGAHLQEDPATALADKRIICFMGGGNNAGDAAAVARHLYNAGATVLVIHTRPLEAFANEAAWHIDQAMQHGVPFLPYDPAANSFIPATLSSKQLAYWNDTDHSIPALPDVVIDGLLGTGLKGDVSEEMLAPIRHINTLGQHAFVMSLDIPSGLNGETGIPAPECVQADCTVTFQAAKLGLVQPEAHEHTGTLYVREIGIPQSVQKKLPAAVQRTTDAVAMLPPPPSAAMHKGTAGHVLILGGSTGLSGAPLLAALGALRSGAGLVTVALPERLESHVKCSHPDIMTVPVQCGDNWEGADPECIVHLLQRCGALLVGNGMGRSEHAARLFANVIELPRPATIFDADALFHLRHPTHALALMREIDILTPHPGEMAFLTGLTCDQVQADRLAAMKLFTQRCPATCLLKGAGTLVANSRSFTAFINAGAPSLAVGGSGDVLAGMCAAFTAQGLGPFNATVAAAHIHGKAGEQLLRENPLRGTTATEIADIIPRTRKELYHA
ncbi:NAD(P)H-hydrate dehydratase [Oleidesulfovibrio sp.]|uniref:NAD(P)H-hydrate dehydratase n=1 Tax=Oleidesulfovibrio sp. TaxID=2909707 RepID=UPI003A8426FA